MGDRGIASGGKKLSRYQINEMIKSPAEKFIILLDPDAYKEAIDLALKLCPYKKVKVVKLPEGKDCNDLGRKEVLRYVYQVHYQNYQELLQLKMQL